MFKNRISPSEQEAIMDCSLFKIATFCADTSTPINISLSSTSSDSESEDTDQEIFLKKKRTKVKQYVEKVVSKYDWSGFRQHFRLNRTLAGDIMGKKKVHLEKEEILTRNKILALFGERKQPQHHGGRPEVPIEKRVLLSLWYLANNETFRQVSDRFDVSLSTAHDVLEYFTNFLLSCSNTYIKWPSAENAACSSREFKKKHDLGKKVIGALDGCHIRIKKPVKNGDDYINRKSYASIILQAICNENKEVIDVFVGLPGSSHDARVLRKSVLCQKAENEDIFYGQYCIIGDSAYPSTGWLVPPIKDTGLLTEAERTFNYKHSSLRVIIEHCFGLLKARFRRLQFFNNNNIELINKLTAAACILHNLCVRANDGEFDVEALSEEND